MIGQFEREGQVLSRAMTLDRAAIGRAKPERAYDVALWPSTFNGEIAPVRRAAGRRGVFLVVVFSRAMSTSASNEYASPHAPMISSVAASSSTSLIAPRSDAPTTVNGTIDRHLRDHPGGSLRRQPGRIRRFDLRAPNIRGPISGGPSRRMVLVIYERESLTLRRAPPHPTLLARSRGQPPSPRAAGPQ